MNANTNIHVLHPVLLHSQLILIFFLILIVIVEKMASQSELIIMSITLHIII